MTHKYRALMYSRGDRPPARFLSHFVEMRFRPGRRGYSMTDENASFSKVVAYIAHRRARGQGKRRARRGPRHYYRTDECRSATTKRYKCIMQCRPWHGRAQDRPLCLVVMALGNDPRSSFALHCAKLTRNVTSPFKRCRVLTCKR